MGTPLTVTSERIDLVRDMARRHRLTLTEDEIEYAAALIQQTGSLAPEAAVVSRFTRGDLTPGVLTLFLPNMWTCKQDDSPIPTDVWRDMFIHAHYTQDWTVCPQPKRAFRLYRGATEANREGIGWSLDRGQAAYFARSRQAPGTTGSVWVANVPGCRALARYTDGWEQEVTADVRDLDIRPVEEEHLLPKPNGWLSWLTPRPVKSAFS